MAIRRSGFESLHVANARGAEYRHNMESHVRDIARYSGGKSMCSAHGADAGCGALIADVVLADAGSDNINWAVCARWLRENEDAAGWLRSHPQKAAELGEY
jgi:hypothetical protein